MNPIIHPPDPILRAYADLITHVFTYLRNTELSNEERFDLGDALHNVGELITEYGKWTSDAHFRKVYLRPYDVKWGNQKFKPNLENYVQRRIEFHSQ